MLMTASGLNLVRDKDYSKKELSCNLGRKRLQHHSESPDGLGSTAIAQSSLKNVRRWHIYQYLWQFVPRDNDQQKSLLDSCLHLLVFSLQALVCPEHFFPFQISDFFYSRCTYRASHYLSLLMSSTNCFLGSIFSNLDLYGLLHPLGFLTVPNKAYVTQLDSGLYYLSNS